jgi:hypothetical protein
VVNASRCIEKKIKGHTESLWIVFDLSENPLA